MIRLHRPLVIFLSETKCDKVRFEVLKRGLKFENGLAEDSIGKGGGIGLLWRNTVDVVIRSVSSNHIDCCVSYSGKRWQFSGIYGCPEMAKKKLTCDLLRRLDNNDDSPWLIGGDLNECLWANEKKGGSSRMHQTIDLFRDTIDDLHLKDLGYTGSPFTWSNRRKFDTPIFKRLDRFLGNEAFRNLFNDLKVLHLDWYDSDHRPICIDLKCFSSTNLGSNRGSHPNSRFRFEELWTQEEECGILLIKVGRMKGLMGITVHPIQAAL